MKRYLLDTNICIFFLKGKFDLHNKITKLGEVNCFISEVTVAELKYGAEKSDKPLVNKKIVNAFVEKFTILPIFSSLDVYAVEKARLRKSGNIIDDFDLLIGATAITNQMIMVTNNVNHLNRMSDIIIEDWVKQDSIL